MQWTFTLSHERPADDDPRWQPVTLPHDWSITGERHPDAPSDFRGGYFPGGIGWYRATFDAPRDQRVFVVFEGIAGHSRVWINDHLLGERPNPYVRQRYELTPYLRQTNTLLVQADNSQQPDSRWYVGCGIYRPVRLIVTGATAIEHVTITTPDQVVVRTTLDGPGEAFTTLYDADGQIAAEGSDGVLTISNPVSWSPDQPYLYTARTVVEGSDSVTTAVGIRQIDFTADNGFWLNGENIKLKGVCNHHDLGALGAAMNRHALARRLEILKVMGCNAIRTAHNPPSPTLLDLCDRMGFLVMDEIFDEWRVGKVEYGYHRHFDAWSERDLREAIRRDRSHPCVVMWSLGNEVREHGTEDGVATLRRLLAIAREEDSTRPITVGCNSMDAANASGFAQLLDVVGYNGGGGSVFMYQSDRETYPERKFIATEVPHTFQTRGVYRTRSWYRDEAPRGGIQTIPDLTGEELFPDESPFHSSSYDNATVRISARDAWRLTRDLPYLAGEFRWTGFDYYGEAISRWPARLWNFGVIDTCGFPKDTYYFYRSQWTDAPMVHLLPHWTHREGMTVPVWCYTNCDSAELFLNGRSLGEQVMGDKMHLEWLVPFEPGELRVIGKRGGEVVADAVQHTAGSPARLRLLPDKATIQADGHDLVHVTVRVEDAAGTRVPTANTLIDFEFAGGILRLDNGDPIDDTPFDGTQKRAFRGLCLALLRSDRVGTLTLKASAPGLIPAQVKVTCRSLAASGS